MTGKRTADRQPKAAKEATRGQEESVGEKASEGPYASAGEILVDDARDEPLANAGPIAPAPAGTPLEPWDSARELEIDRRGERRLLVRELCVLALIAGLVVLRILFVHGS